MQRESQDTGQDTAVRCGMRPLVHSFLKQCNPPFFSSPSHAIVFFPFFLSFCLTHNKQSTLRCQVYTNLFFKAQRTLQKPTIVSPSPVSRPELQHFTAKTTATSLPVCSARNDPPNQQGRWSVLSVVLEERGAPLSRLSKIKDTSHSCRGADWLELKANQPIGVTSLATCDSND